jgi:hypothetical protein
MKYLKTKNISKFSIKDNTYIQNTYGRITIDSNNSMRLPKGTTNERPNTSIPNLAGAIRYNTSTGGIEAYIGLPGEEVWEIVKAPSGTTITRDTIGPGNSNEIYFGPLRTEFEGTYLSSGNNIVVLVENVWQIWQTNFNIVPTPSGPALASYTSSDPLAPPVSAGQPYPPGYYLEFADDFPVPSGKNITVYYGFV